MNPDEGYANLISLIEEFSSYKHLSEADTRCKIIDKIFINCLGYDEENFRREPNVDSGYVDYVVTINKIPFLIIEAKKNGDVFNIASGHNKRIYKINGSISSNKNLVSAMQQARSYCLDLGVKYAIVSNGFQFVSFIAFLPGKKWNEGNCVIYNSLDDIKDNFSIFWNSFSYDSLKNGSFLNFIEDRRSNLDFRKLSLELHNPDQKWERNRIYTYLSDIVDFIFTELLEYAKLNVLKQCYVYDRSNQELGLELDSLFVDKMPYFSDNLKIQNIVETETKAGAFEKKIRELRKTESELPLVVLLGGIGSGKSTFIHRFFRVIMESRESLFWFYLDFRYSSIDPLKVEEYIYSQIIDQFRDGYLDKIASKLSEIGFSLDYSNKLEFIKRLFAVQKILRISPILIIDNVDQHEYGFQEKLFLFTNHICKEFNVLTILALREETFIKSTQTGVFGAYHVAKFHISSPNFINMVRERIKYSLNLLQSHKFVTEKKFDTDIAKELEYFFEVLLRSFNKDNDQSKNIVRFFDSISVGNMREALRMFNSFLISGNTNISDMLIKEPLAGQGRYQIAYHQLLKSIMLGEYRFYKSTRSHIANVFDFDPGLSDSHFNQLRILNYLFLKQNSESPIGRGYIAIDELNIKAESVMISKKIIIDSILRMLKFNLVALDNQSNENIESASYITITLSGVFYLQNLVKNFTYLNNILIDTPISDAKILNDIRFSLNGNDIHNRVVYTVKFIKYLLISEKDEFLRNPQFLQSSFSNKYFMEEICKSVNEFILNLIRNGILHECKEYSIDK